MHEVDISVVAKLFVQTGKAMTAQGIREATDRVAGNMERGLVLEAVGALSAVVTRFGWYAEACLSVPLFVHCVTY